VAILQISRITQRKGLAQDLPEPLAGAELGWAVDTRQLFIGNGELTEGAPVVGNTEILTEFSDILEFTTAYTYKGAAAGYDVQTGATSGSPVSQSLQSRLDSYAVVTDFGATGDGVTDDTAAINRALFQLYCRQLNTQVRRSLFFPAGTYLITDTILIPPFAQLYGEGPNSSIIKFSVETWTNAIPYDTGVLVYYPAGSGGAYYFRSVAAVPVGTAISNTSYWDPVPEGLPEYVVRTTDNLQQTGGVSSGATYAPQSIEVTNMCFQTLNSDSDSTQSHNILRVEAATQVAFTNVTFRGPFTTSTDINTVSDARISGVKFASPGTYICNQINFDNCRFTGVTYGIFADATTQGVTISNSYFDAMYQGIILDYNPITGQSPTGVRMVHNTFDNVYRQGIEITGATFNVSAYNIFYDVGNNYTVTATTPVISFDTDNNVSMGDMFERTTAQSATYPRVSLGTTGSIAFGMNTSKIGYVISGVANTTIANQLNLGQYVRTTGVVSTLADSAATSTLFTVDSSATGIRAFRMDYTIKRGTTYRTGTITIVSGTTFSFTDDYSDNASTGFVLSAAEASSVVTVSYTDATPTGTAGSITYSITHLA
jgi:hypothetical protein